MTRLLTRRSFVAGAAGAAVLTSRKGFSQASTQAKIHIDLAKEGGVIRPELHGHFAEHLGSCVYGGLWVGKNSSIPNINGHRKQAVEYLKALGIPVLRWPGGCYADDYHWREGIGPAGKRPKRVNIFWGQYTEDNSYGTHEFVELCRLIGAQPYLAGNVGSGSPQELRDWVEYCNYPSGSALSDERIANGAKEPFGVRFWGVGNENWGCGGRMLPHEYAAHYRRFATYLTPRGGIGPTELYLIACGPSRNDHDWTRGFFDAMPARGRRGPRGVRGMSAFAMHFYSRGPLAATKFTPEALRRQLASFADLETAILEQRQLLDRYDPEGNIDLLVDEWGVWDSIQDDDVKRYGALFQQITMRSAVAAAMGLNVFHRQADKLGMTNIAQLVNVLHSLLLTEGERCIRTPTYYVYDLMKAHRTQKSVFVQNEDPSPLAVSVGASRQGHEMVVTLANPSHEAGAKVSCELSGGNAESGKARILHHADMNAHNTFSNPDIIVPKDHAVTVAGGRIEIELPPLAVATATVHLT
jgi:alpha-N-arabinofuranosidase